MKKKIKGKLVQLLGVAATVGSVAGFRPQTNELPVLRTPDRKEITSDTSQFEFNQNDKNNRESFQRSISIRNDCILQYRKTPDSNPKLEEAEQLIKGIKELKVRKAAHQKVLSGSDDEIKSLTSNPEQITEDVILVKSSGSSGSTILPGSHGSTPNTFSKRNLGRPRMKGSGSSRSVPVKRHFQLTLRLIFR